MNTRVSLHLGYGEKKPAARLCTYPASAPIGAVDLDGGVVTVASLSPADLLLVAEAFTDAARRLSQQLDIEAAREINVAAVPA